MRYKERKTFTKIIDVLNYARDRKKYLKNFLAVNNFINPFLNVKTNIDNLFPSSKILKNKVSFHKAYRTLHFETNNKIVKKSYGYDISNFLGELGGVSSKKGVLKKPPDWKKPFPEFTMEKVKSLIHHLLQSLIDSRTVTSRLKRLEELLDHIIKHPSAKHFAIKHGAIGILLFFRKNTNDVPTLEIISQIFSILGYVDPPNSSGVRILSIDGGGMRGIAVIRMLQRIEEISGKRICDLFDFICGVSTGAVITSCLVPPNNMPLCRIYDLYRSLSSQVFNQSAFWGTSKLLWSGAYYDTALWEKFLHDHVGKLTLIETAKDPSGPKVAIVSTVINQSKVAPFVFRNYCEPYNRSLEYLGSYKHSVFEAVRASAAAPTIFEEFKIGDLLHQDGGLVVNNPTAIALHEAKTLWPDESISCVVSIGTGRYEPVLTTIDETSASSKSSSWKQIFNKILESATDTEAVHRILNDLLPDDVYFRFNPHLSHQMTMDEISEFKILELEKDTKMYCRRNEDKFNDVVSKLIVSRPVTKKIMDYFKLKMKIFGKMM